jgi:diacylglycerol kinase family enzyme
LDSAGRLIDNGVTTPVNVGCAGTRYFLMSAGLGLDVEVASKSFEKSNTLMKKVWESAKPFIDHITPIRVKLFIDNTYVLNIELVSCSIVNLTTYFAKSIPEITFSHNDDLLHLIAFSSRKKENIVPKLIHHGTFDMGDLHVTQLKAKNIQILYPEDIPLHADGEILRQTTPIESAIQKYKQPIITGL